MWIFVKKDFLHAKRSFSVADFQYFLHSRYWLEGPPFWFTRIASIRTLYRQNWMVALLNIWVSEWMNEWLNDWLFLQVHTHTDHCLALRWFCSRQILFDFQRVHTRTRTNTNTHTCTRKFQDKLISFIRYIMLIFSRSVCIWEGSVGWVLWFISIYTRPLQVLIWQHTNLWTHSMNKHLSLDVRACTSCASSVNLITEQILDGPEQIWKLEHNPKLPLNGIYI